MSHRRLPELCCAKKISEMLLKRLLMCTGGYTTGKRN